MQIQKIPNLLRIRNSELKSKKLSHSQRVFSRFLRNIPHKLSIYWSSDFKGKFCLVEPVEKINIWSNYLIFFFFVIGSMKCQTLLISLAKQKQSDHKQIIWWQSHIGSLSSLRALVETLKAVIHSGPDLCW